VSQRQHNSVAFMHAGTQLPGCSARRVLVGMDEFSPHQGEAIAHANRL